MEFLQAKHHAETILKAFYTRIPALKQRGGRQLPDSLRQRALSHEHLAKQSERDGSYQLGTLGCGNHFAELQEDDSGILWFMVHSGSRAMGQIITNHHLTQASLSSTGLQFLDSQSDAGQAYLNDMEWAQKYATLNRLAIMAQVAEILDSFFSLSVQEDSYLDCPHNFLRRENHFGTELLVHRKSAISAQSGEPGLVAGSMGTPSYIVRGQGFSDALCSSSHGAGRLLSRTEARKRISSSIMERQLGSVHYDQANLRTLRDEAPGVYRDLREVMRAQHDLTRQEIRLTPKLNFKYPDPHRD